MSFERGIDGSDPVLPQPIGRLARSHEDRQDGQTRILGSGTLACPECDAPVALPGRPVSPAEPLACPFCDHGAAVRDFLSLTAPARPARVEVRVIQRVRPRAR